MRIEEIKLNRYYYGMSIDGVMCDYVYIVIVVVFLDVCMYSFIMMGL